MNTKRFYIGKIDISEDLSDLEEWIASKIPRPPDGKICECDKAKHAHESEPDEDGMVEIVYCTAPATTYLYTVKDKHVCYTWMCDPCMEAQASDDYLGDVDYPTTESGYAVTPQHCA